MTQFRKNNDVRNIILGISGALLFALWILCFKMISPGYVGIIVNLFGDDKGPSCRELGVGMHWIAPWKRVYKFPMFEINETWEGKEGFVFQTGEGLRVGANMGISFHLEPGKVHTLFAKYRRGIEEITDIFVHNYVRDSVNTHSSKMKIEELYGNEKEQFLLDIQNDVKKSLEQLGICVDRIYIIGTLIFPDSVIHALNAKIEATQRAQQRENELREARAQAEKEIAAAQGRAQSVLIEAQSQAQANQIMSQSLTQELIMYELSKKWDGALPKFVGQSVPLLNIQ